MRGAENGHVHSPYLPPFFSSLMLALEAQKVIELRLVRLAWGGQDGRGEAISMVTEKIDAVAADVKLTRSPTEL